MLLKKIQRKIYNKKFKLYHKHYPIICERKDFKTKRKILVIESDDWGSIRVPSVEVKKSMIAHGYDMDSDPFESADTLESNCDLKELYSILLKFEDKHGHHPVITANTVTSNPDFERIKNSNFEAYYYEPTSKTYQSHFGSDKVLELVNKGIEMGVYYPQFHGREHFNFTDWIEQLQLGKNKDVLLSFEHKMCGVSPKGNPSKGNLLMRALRYDSEPSRKAVISSVSEGLKMFENQFGYKSKTFVAPCYWWSPAIEKVLSENGVKLIQTDRAYGNCDDGQIYYHYSGEKNRYGQCYSIRNCMFEPAIFRKGDEAQQCFEQIKKSFDQRKVAVVSSHRINYVGGIMPENREKTLKQLDWLLSVVMEKYPDVEFMTSDDLFNKIYCHV